MLATELTTFRYRPRCTETRREETAPPSRAASAGAVRQFRAASAPPVAHGLRARAPSQRRTAAPSRLQLPDPLPSPQRVSRDDRFVELGTAGGDAGLGLGLGH